MGADRRGGVDDRENLVRLRAGALVGARREEVDAGIDVGEGVAHLIGDGDRLERVLGRLRPVLQHFDLRAAGECAGQLARHGEAGERRDGTVRRLEGLVPPAGHPVDPRAQGEHGRAHPGIPRAHILGAGEPLERVVPARVRDVELGEGEQRRRLLAGLCSHLVACSSCVRAAT